VGVASLVGGRSVAVRESVGVADGDDGLRPD
jgi:hypothetical protein